VSESLDRVRSEIGRLRQRRLGELAVHRKLITAEQLEEAWRLGGPLGQALVGRGFITEAVRQELSRELDGPRTAGGRYELGEKLGEGAVSVVYRAFDRDLGRPVAVKLLKETFLSQETVRQRFYREAQALARMDHPAVVRVYDAGEEGGQMFLVMELVEGESLAGLLKRERPGSPRLLLLLEKAARGVQHAHEKGIIHRDLKPENILVAGGHEAKVADFGLAHLALSAPALTRSGTVLGTPMYMAPEQVRGNPEGITERTDIYALGAILYQVLVGEPPHTGQSVPEVYDRIAREDVVPPRRQNPRLSWELEAIAMKAIEKDPSRRYARAADFAEDLRKAFDGEPILARPVREAARFTRRLLRHRALVLAAAGALSLAVAFSAWVWAGRIGRHRQERALQLLEAGLPPLSRARAALYNPQADYEALLKPLGEAQGLIEEAIRLAPDLALGPHRLGEVWELKGEYPRAEASWRKATELDPAFGPAHYRLGRVLLSRAYLASLAFYAEEREPHRAEGVELARRGAREIEAAGSVFDSDLQREIAQAMLACLRDEREPARRICREGIRRFGKQEGVEDLHWLLGLVSDGPAEQWRALNEAVALRPKFPLALYCRAGVRSHSGDLEGAIADYDEAIKVNPGFAEAYLNRGSARFGKGDGPGAYHDFDWLIEHGLLLPGAHNGRGRTLLECMNRPLEAIPDLDRAIALQPEGYVLPYMARARARLALGRLDGAIADADKALGISRWSEIYFIRGQAKLAQGDRPGARKDLEEALRTAGPEGAYRKSVEAMIEKARN
jgi:tetratricopeptide (TPR) repeat protein/tRNA A-37 threonylcarbamoyl transferase component Bud32